MAEEWVTVSEAARRAGANKSSISRFLDRNADVPVRRDGGGRVNLVEYGALSAARKSSLSVQDSQHHPNESPTPGGQGAASGARKRDLEIEKLELDLADRKGEVIDRAAVQLFIESAGVALVQALERSRRGLADRIASLSDTRAVELELKANDRALLQAFADDLGRAAAGVSAVSADESAAAA
jgi:hypothetical protein